MYGSSNDRLFDIICGQLREIRRELLEVSEREERDWLIQEQYKLALILDTLHDENKGKKDEAVDFDN